MSDASIHYAFIFMWLAMLGRDCWSHTPNRVLSDKITLLVVGSWAGGSIVWQTGHIEPVLLCFSIKFLCWVVEKWWCFTSLLSDEQYAHGLSAYLCSLFTSRSHEWSSGLILFGLTTGFPRLHRVSFPEPICLPSLFIILFRQAGSNRYFTTVVESWIIARCGE